MAFSAAKTLVWARWSGLMEADLSTSTTCMMVSISMSVSRKVLQLAVQGFYKTRNTFLILDTTQNEFTKQDKIRLSKYEYVFLTTS